MSDFITFALMEALPRPYDVHTIVTLKHALRPVIVKVHTGLDGTSIITRWLEITNTATQPAALSAAFPWSGVLQKTIKRCIQSKAEKLPL